MSTTIVVLIEFNMKKTCLLITKITVKLSIIISTKSKNLLVFLNNVYLNDRSAITPLVQANLFNEYFHSVYGTSSTSSFLPNSPPTTECLSDITISEEDVFQILSSLDPSKAMGIDHIGPRILKSCAVSLSGPLSLLFQRCIDLACIPDEWKIHVITPLLKKGLTLLMFPIIDLYLCCVPSPKY